MTRRGRPANAFVDYIDALIAPMLSAGDPLRRDSRDVQAERERELGARIIAQNRRLSADGVQARKKIREAGEVAALEARKLQRLAEYKRRNPQLGKRGDRAAMLKYVAGTNDRIAIRKTDSWLRRRGQ